MECFGSFFYLDGTIIPAGHEDEIAPGEVSFYEVIRTREGIPLFFDDHMKRLSEGIATRYDSGGDIAGKVREGLDALVSAQSFPEINVKVTVSFTGREYSLHICYIPSSYPDEEMISRGVGLILYRAERFDPGVKLLNKRLRLSVDEELERREAYEALLVNRDGYITEGSRSNVFFVTAGGAIHTAPDRMVLQGITRRYVIDLIRQERFKLVYEAVRETDISNFSGVFITGTSPMVLPVHSIEKQYYATYNTVTERLRILYTGLAAASILDYKLNKSKD
ncbi:MAG: aminotransferase class IV [Bacteroidales bacterium]